MEEMTTELVPITIENALEVFTGEKLIEVVGAPYPTGLSCAIFNCSLTNFN